MEDESAGICVVSS